MTSRSMDRSPWQTGSAPIRQTISRPLRVLSELRDDFPGELLQIDRHVPGFGSTDSGERQQVVDQITHSPGRAADRLDVVTALFVDRGRRTRLQQLREADHVAQRRTQVVRHRIGEQFEFFVGRFQLRGSSREFLVQSSDFVLAALALGDVVVCRHDEQWPPLVIAPQRPPAGGDDLAPVGLGVPEFAFPHACPPQFLLDVR